MAQCNDRWLFLGVGLGTALSSVAFRAWGTPLPSAIAPSLSPSPAVDWLQAMVLGLVQGLTEFLPISSTGHLIVVAAILGWPSPSVALSAVLELGSIAAVIWYFRAMVWQLLQGSVRAIRVREYQSQDLRLTVGIALGTLPIVALGLALKIFHVDLEHSPLRSLPAIAIASILMAGLMGAAEWVSQHQRAFDRLRIADGIWMGLAQMFAVIPGISRSGSTLTAGLFLGLERATAARFSFLLAIPAITLAGMLGVIDLLEAGVSRADGGAMLLGGGTSAVVSYGAIAWLLQFLQTRTTWIFVWYRLVFGLLILLSSAIGVAKVG